MANLHKLIVVILLCFSTFSLSACSRSFSLVIFNNTGLALEIIEATNNDNELKSKGFIINNGEGRNLKVADNGGDWRIIAMVGECRVVYKLPSIVQLATYPWEVGQISHYIKVQVEPDFGVHLIPETAKEIVDVRQFSERQEAGFPIYPDETNCIAA
jgi:hypothetical protein